MMFDRDKPVMVLGAGAWGTALALHLDRLGQSTILWTRNQTVVEEIKSGGRNDTYLPDHPIPTSIQVTSEHRAITEAAAVLVVIPTQHLRAHLPAFRIAAGAASVPLALCCKGIEQGSGLLVHEVVTEVWPEASVALLSGPSFAADVAAGKPVAVTMADEDPDRMAQWQQLLSGPSFRPYGSDDLIGVALGGAVKNVLAIGCGIVEGAGLGESARAALMARGVAETLRFAKAKGARVETLNGLSGLGDIILTCGSRQSRNMSLGVALGQGQSVASLIKSRNTVAEGAATAPILASMAQDLGIEMPIAAAIAALVAGQATTDETVAALMSRPLRSEA